MSKPDSFMPRFIGDYHRDTLHLTTRQHGAYTLLLDAYWINGGPLPDDDDRLRAIARESASEWKVDRGVVLAFFEKRDGLLYQKRCSEELEKAKVRYGARQTASRTANDARWGNRDGVRHASETETVTHPNLHLLPSPKGKGSKQRAAERDRPATPPAVNEPGWEANYPRWAEFRAEIGDAEWTHRFSGVRPNGSETTLIVASELEASRIIDGCAKRLEAHFGQPVLVKVQTPNLKPGA